MGKGDNDPSPFYLTSLEWGSIRENIWRHLEHLLIYHKIFIVTSGMIYLHPVNTSLLLGASGCYHHSNGETWNSCLCLTPIKIYKICKSNHLSLCLLGFMKYALWYPFCKWGYWIQRNEVVCLCDYRYDVEASSILALLQLPTPSKGDILDHPALSMLFFFFK